MPAVGSILQATPATYVNPYNYALTGTTTAFTAYSITLDGGSATNNAYVDYALCYVNQTNPGINRGIESYDGTTKIATLYPVGWSSVGPSQLLQATVTTFDNTTIYLGDSPYASNDNGSYFGLTLAFKNQTNSPTPRTIIGYNGATKTATLSGADWAGYPPVSGTTVWALYSWDGFNPVIGTTIWGITNQYPVQRSFQWIKDGVDIPGAFSSGGSFTPYTAGSYQFRETAFYPNTSSLTTSTTSAAVTITGTRDAALVYADNLVWEGAFYCPGSPEMAYGGNIAYNSVGNGGAGSLFVQALGGNVGEVSIPTPSTNTGSLPTANLLNTTVLVDPFEGQLSTSGLSGEGKTLGGLLVDNGKLLMTAHISYGGTAAWFWRRPLNLLTTGQVEGPFSVTDPAYNNNQRYYAGYMASVPSSLQTKLGGNIVAGLAAGSIVSTTSDGPAYTSFNTSSFDTASANVKRGAYVGAGVNTMDLSSGSSMSSVTDFYVGYWLTNDSGSSGHRQVTAYNGTTKVATVSSNWSSTPTSGNWVLIPQINGKCMTAYTVDQLQTSADFGHPYIWDQTGSPIAGYAIPNGTRSVLAFSRGGNNMYLYSAPNQVRSGVKCQDPQFAGTGEHNYPYTVRCWAYDANELEQARLGNIAPGSVKPYAVINWAIPIEINRGAGPLGATYDPVNKRIFLATLSVPAFGRIVINVFTVTNATYP